MDIYREVELQDCPLCHGASLLEEVSGWAFYVMCLDCGCHTVEVEFSSESEAVEAAKTAAHLWNIGKVLTSSPGE